MSQILKSLFVVLALVSMPISAQQAPVDITVSSSEPGKAFAGETVRASAVVIGINKSARTLTLKGPKGRYFDVVAGDQVKNFDQIKLRDEIALTYVEAISLELRKGGGLRKKTERFDSAHAQPGEKPAEVVGRQVTIIADVVDVNPNKKTITLKGPKGNVVVFNVKNPDHFKVVKKGDQVEADYIEAVAVVVEPAKK